MPPRPATPKPLLPLTGDRAAGETDSAVIACNDWLRLGPGRTLPLLLAKYTKTRQNAPPTTSLDTLKDWSRNFGWKARATIYDAGIEDAKTARRDKYLNSGFALDYERVRVLGTIARLLEREVTTKKTYTGEDKQTHTMPGYQVHDVKSVGGRGVCGNL